MLFLDGDDRQKKLRKKREQRFETIIFVVVRICGIIPVIIDNETSRCSITRFHFFNCVVMMIICLFWNVSKHQCPYMERIHTFHFNKA